MNISRRDVLKLAAGGAAAAGLASCAEPGAAPSTAAAPRMPVVFLSHGSPMVGLSKDDYTAAIGKMGTELPTPKAVVVVSAHWAEYRPVRVSPGGAPELIYDFYGFPKPLYELKYPAPGHPALAAEIAAAFQAGGVPAVVEERGLDHGAWVPLRLAYPGADVPVLQVTLPADATPAQLVELGRMLAPLRRRGVLLLGSGGMTHNFDLAGRGATPDASMRKFDAWVREKVGARDLDSLVRYAELAPHAELAHPTTEHFDPIFVVLGASDPADRVRDVYEGWQGANFSMRTFALS